MSGRLIVVSLAALLVIGLGSAAAVDAAQSPIGVAFTAEGSTQPNNVQRLFVDAFGKYLALLVRPDFGSAAIWSNDDGQTWSAPLQLKTAEGLGFQSRPSGGTVTPDGQRLHYVGRAVNSGYIIYGSYQILRDASNNIVALGTDLSNLGRSSHDIRVDNAVPYVERPSIVLQANGLPAIAWAIDTTGGVNQSGIRFSRAACDPSQQSCWRTATGCTTASCGAVRLLAHFGDHLSYNPKVDDVSQVVLLKAPTVAGQSWSDELVLLYTRKSDRTLYARRATVNGANYNPWSSPVALYTDVDDTNLRLLNLSAAVDPVNNRIWFAYSARVNTAYRTVLADIDLAASTDTVWQTNRYQLFDPAPGQGQSAQPNAPSVSYDRVDNQVYVFGELNGIMYRRWHVATGMADTADIVVRPDAAARGPSAFDAPVLGGEVPLLWHRQHADGRYSAWFAQVGP